MKLPLVLSLLLLAPPALAQSTTPAELIAKYGGEAASEASATRGQALFMASHTGGKPETASCTTCHTGDPKAVGQARTGKPIDPLAPSVNPERFTDLKFVEKWFGRNCNSVLGRDCTAAEKADIIAWLSSL